VSSTLLALPPGEVHVWRAELDVPLPQLARLAASLTPQERGRAMRLRRQRDRDRWVAARGILRAVLAAYAGVEPAALVLGLGAHGKPYLVEDGVPAPLRFNVAHADAVALIALAIGREVGVDVEREGPVDLGVARRLFSAEEAAALAALPVDARAAAFVSVWAAREAYAKGVGLGLDAMSATPTADWTVHALSVGPGYAGALAVERGAEAVLCREWPAA